MHNDYCQENCNMIKNLTTCMFFSLCILARNSFSDGFLSVRTDPDGIEVWLDDNFVGDSPIIDKKLKSGRYSLKLVDPVQHSSTIEEIFVQDNENTVIEKTIKSKFGSLRVNTVPEGAIVSIATELGPTPVTNDFMNPSKYRVEIKHPDKKYIPITEEVIIPRGESISLTKTLEREKTFTNKDKWRLILGAGTVLGYAVAIWQQGNYNEYSLKDSYGSSKCFQDLYQEKDVNYHSKANGALLYSILGMVFGSGCLIGLEIVAFY
jgi:hypothetical protein